MARFLFTVFGTSGDIYPYISISKELIKKGHHAHMLCPVEYRDLCNRHKITHHSLSPSFQQLGGYKKFIQRSFNRISGTEYWIRRILMERLDDVYDDTYAASQGMDLIISHPLSLVTPLVAEKLGIKWISTALAPISMISHKDRSIMPPPISWVRHFARTRWLHKWVYKMFEYCFGFWEEPLRKLTHTLNIPKQKNSFFHGQFSPYLHLALFDSILSSSQKDWPINTIVCGNPVYKEEQASSKELDQLNIFLKSGDAPIVFTLGTSASYLVENNFWGIALTVISTLNKRAIFLTGSIDQAFSYDSSRVFVSSYLPHSYIFNNSCLIVHQAGIGTLSKAMRSGKPQLLLPVSWDQPDNANRARRLGVAKVLSFHKINERRLKNKVAQCLSDNHLRYKSAQIAKGLSQDLVAASTAKDELINLL